VANEFNLQIAAGNPDTDLYALKPLKLGLYKPWMANMSEGWTRWIFDTWEFPYKTLHNPDLQNMDLKSDHDVIVLPDMRSAGIINGYPKGSIPEKYSGGIGEAGLAALKKFVSEGGTLITLNNSSQFAIDLFGLPLKNNANVHPSTEFFCPSAILKVELANDHPVTFGMGSSSDILFYGSPLLDFLNTEELSKRKDGLPVSQLKVVASFPDSNPFRSGRLIGEGILHKKPVLIEAAYGKGKIVMFAFHPQHRAQTHGTFMLFFNSLYYGQALLN
jgi:hypothetical protein